MEPRSAQSAGKEFPYTSPTTCFIEVDKTGKVSQIVTHDKALYDRISSGESKLYAVWPGNYRSDLFEIDDCEEYAKARGIIHDSERAGLQEHEHQVEWQIDRSDLNARGAYVNVNVRLDCGCRIRDIKVFGEHMRNQKGWDVATSHYPGSIQEGTKPPVYTIRVRRLSLH